MSNIAEVHAKFQEDQAKTGDENEKVYRMIFYRIHLVKMSFKLCEIGPQITDDRPVWVLK